jgi:hypothetical protein
MNVQKLLDEVAELRDGFQKQLEAVQTGTATVVPLPGIPNDDLLEHIKETVVDFSKTLNKYGRA